MDEFDKFFFRMKIAFVILLVLWLGSCAYVIYGVQEHGLESIVTEIWEGPEKE